ncbi:hypothetical protein ACJX0J_011492, partial [Zea mays]
KTHKKADIIFYYQYPCFLYIGLSVAYSGINLFLSNFEQEYDRIYPTAQF